ncbi:PREDICTED: Retrovirus-related Pol poly from [Prunus dulcis]|uniref:PREDICTED: Retrovirus-related Pol poly from n=1 Tax=Prunus dulcis TaxID=3755 RepID=A0A5E4G0H9_PRUDU|nr:PREDICTED: Retrovirus-related Pol poly from [Prunus dulcis]
MVGARKNLDSGVPDTSEMFPHCVNKDLELDKDDIVFGAISEEQERWGGPGISSEGGCLEPLNWEGPQFGEVENLTRKKIKFLRSDNGGEYKDSKSLEFCKGEGDNKHFTMKKTPQQNGAAKRMNRTLMECERSMRIYADLSEAFWAEAVNHASYLVNMSPSKSLDFKCAEETKILGREVVFDENTMLMIKIKKLEAKEDVVGIKTTVSITPRRVFEDTPRMQPIEDAHEAVESNTKVEELGQQQKAQDEKEE